MRSHALQMIASTFSTCPAVVERCPDPGTRWLLANGFQIGSARRGHGHSAQGLPSTPSGTAPRPRQPRRSRRQMRRSVCGNVVGYGQWGKDPSSFHCRTTMDSARFRQALTAARGRIKTGSTCVQCSSKRHDLSVLSDLSVHSVHHLSAAS